MENKKIYYYRIFDDNEELDFLKSSLEYEKIRDLIKEFESKHSDYYNKEFVEFMKNQDPEAEIIDVTNIYY